MAKESIPSQIALQLAYLASVSAKITATPADYGTDADGATALSDLVTTATGANDAAVAGKMASKATTSALEEALSAAVAAFRNLAQQARFNPDVTDESLADIGLKRKGDPSRIAAPPDAPIVSIEKLMVGFAGIKLQVPDQAGHARPAGAIGAQVSLVDGTVTPDNDNPELGVLNFVSKTRSRIPTDIGKTRVRLYARWMNQRGETSPWSLPAQFSPQQA